MFDHNTKLLQEILAELQANNALLRLQAAELIAIKQLDQQIVDNTNPRQVFGLSAVQLK